jgi:hypothetical protein
LGVQEPRPLVGPGDNQAQVDGFAALHLVTGQVTTRLLAQPAHRKVQTGRSTQPRLPAAVVVHLRDIARTYPASV